MDLDAKQVSDYSRCTLSAWCSCYLVELEGAESGLVVDPVCPLWGGPPCCDQSPVPVEAFEGTVKGRPAREP